MWTRTAAEEGAYFGVPCAGLEGPLYANLDDLLLPGGRFEVRHEGKDLLLRARDNDRALDAIGASRKMTGFLSASLDIWRTSAHTSRARGGDLDLRIASRLRGLLRAMIRAVALSLAAALLLAIVGCGGSSPTAETTEARRSRSRHGRGDDGDAWGYGRSGDGHAGSGARVGGRRGCPGRDQRARRVLVCGGRPSRLQPHDRRRCSTTAGRQKVTQG